MEILKDFIFEEIEEKIKNDNYNVVYLNYDKANGIKIFSNLQKLSLDEKKNFYKIYIFNNEYMITIYNFGEEGYKYTKISKEDFDEESIKEKYIYLKILKENFDEESLKEKYMCLIDMKEKKLKVRIGNINGSEEVQYMEFKGGER